MKQKRNKSVSHTLPGWKSPASINVWNRSIHHCEWLRRRKPPIFNALIARWRAVHMGCWWLNSSRLYDSNQNIICTTVSSDWSRISTCGAHTRHEIGGNQTSRMVGGGTLQSHNAPWISIDTPVSRNNTELELVNSAVLLLRDIENSNNFIGCSTANCTGIKCSDWFIDQSINLFSQLCNNKK